MPCLPLLCNTAPEILGFSNHHVVLRTEGRVLPILSHNRTSMKLERAEPRQNSLSQPGRTFKLCKCVFAIMQRTINPFPLPRGPSWKWGTPLWEEDGYGVRHEWKQAKWTHISTRDQGDTPIGAMRGAGGGQVLLLFPFSSSWPWHDDSTGFQKFSESRISGSRGRKPIPRSWARRKGLGPWFPCCGPSRMANSQVRPPVANICRNCSSRDPGGASKNSFQRKI